jgi:hypothetical protein
MNCYSYVIPRDFGFAPNPFGGFCTLATCKPRIRKAAVKGDWILGTGSAVNKQTGRIVYLMNVDLKLTFDQYWHDARFQFKKPIMNGSLKLMYGDNIYHRN